MRYRIVSRAMAPLLRVRFWMADFLFDRFLTGMAKNGEWLDTLFSTLSVGPGQHVLVLGSHSSSIAAALSKTFPTASFTVEDQNKTIRARAGRHTSLPNVANTHPAPDIDVLAFDKQSFHQVVCFLALHERRPEDKLVLLTEIARVLRRGGILYAVEFDKPENDQESKMLRVAGRKSRAAVISHLSGAWLSFFAKAGFSRVRRQSSHSIKAGRLSVVTARK